MGKGIRKTPGPRPDESRGPGGATHAARKHDPGWRPSPPAACIPSCLLCIFFFSIWTPLPNGDAAIAGESPPGESITIMPPSGSGCHRVASRRVFGPLKIQTFCLDVPDAFIEVLIKMGSIFRVSFFLLFVPTCRGNKGVVKKKKRLTERESTFNSVERTMSFS